MDQFQKEIAQMTEILKNAVEDSEARIMNKIEVRADALESTLKAYIDAVVLPYMATIVKPTTSTPPEHHNEQQEQELPPADSDDMEPSSETSVTTTPNSTLHPGIAHLSTAMPSSVNLNNIPPGTAVGAPGTNNATIVHDSDVSSVQNGSRGLRSTNSDGKVTPLPPGRLRAAGNTQSRHDVFIGNLSCISTEDEIRAHLMDIGVENITSISKVLTKNESSCAMRVQINDNSIKHNVYKMDNYEDGIIVKPFRFHESDTANKNTKSSSHQALNNDRNHMYNNSQKPH